MRSPLAPIGLELQLDVPNGVELHPLVGQSPPGDVAAALSNYELHRSCPLRRRRTMLSLLNTAPSVPTSVRLDFGQCESLDFVIGGEHEIASRLGAMRAFQG